MTKLLEQMHQPIWVPDAHPDAQFCTVTIRVLPTVAKSGVDGTGPSALNN